MLKQESENRRQIEFFCVDDFVPKNHLLRKIDKAIDFDCIYEMAGDLYCLDNGLPRLYEYVYDEYYDCVICPNHQVLKYSTTDRQGV